MIDNYTGTSSNTFSVGLYTNKVTFTVNGTNISVDKPLDMASHKITSLTDPGAAQDAMTLNYSDTHYINVNQKGVASGVPTLDIYGKIPVSQLPSSVMEYRGAWDATNNLPVLADAGTSTKAYKTIQDLIYTAHTAGYNGNLINITYTTGGTKGAEVVTVTVNAISVQIESGVSTANNIKTAIGNSIPAAALVDVALGGTGSETQTAPVSATYLLYGQDTAINGNVYRCSVAGTRNLGSGSLAFQIGDFAIYNGTIWQRSPAGGDITGKADKVGSPTNGDLAGLDSTGNLTDSGLLATTMAASSKWIKVTVGTTTATSTFSIPNSSIVTRVIAVVGTPYTAGGTLAVSVGGVTLLATTDNDPQTAASYGSDDIQAITTGNVVTVTIAGSPGNGAAVVYVQFANSLLG